LLSADIRCKKAQPDDAAVIQRFIRRNKVDAFMCGDDETAAKLMQTLHKLGYSIPRDVLVSGFNDLRVARLLSPALTTLRMNCEAIADAAFERLTGAQGLTFNANLELEMRHLC